MIFFIEWNKKNCFDNYSEYIESRKDHKSKAILESISKISSKLGRISGVLSQHLVINCMYSKGQSLSSLMSGLPF